MEDDKKDAVPRAEKEHEKRGAIWILGSSIAGTIGPDRISSETFWT